MPYQADMLRLAAHAKLNLALSVGAPIDAPGTQTHGYHPICSWMHAIELHDAVEMRRLETGPSVYDIGWVREGGRTPVEWDTPGDLCVRAHRAVEETVGRALPAAIRVDKSIPAGGGLGGGSSDAAAVLRGLERLYGLGLGEERIREIATTLGSDIAFFVDGGRECPRPAIVSGLGARIERLEPTHAGVAVTLILPPFGCPTGPVYRRFDARIGADKRSEVERVRGLVAGGELDSSALFNDLGEAAMDEQPRLRAIAAAVREATGAPVHVTGSGSTLFVLGDMNRAVVEGCRVVSTRLR